MNGGVAMPESCNRTLQRGLQILELLSSVKRGMELHEIAKQMELPKSTAHNLVHTLVDCGYIMSDSHGRFQLTPKTYEIGAAGMQDMDIGHALRRCMRHAFNECNETMHLGVLSGPDVVYIDKIESTQSIRMTSRIGSRLPLYATAMGKAFLAAMPDADIRKLYPEKTLPKLTEHTVSSLDELLAQIRRIREAGYAWEDQENAENVSCVAVSILDRDLHPAYALSFSVPAFRMSEERWQTCVKLLMQAREHMERILHTL